MAASMATPQSLKTQKPAAGPARMVQSAPMGMKARGMSPAMISVNACRVPADCVGGRFVNARIGRRIAGVQQAVAQVREFPYPVHVSRGMEQSDLRAARSRDGCRTVCAA